MSDTPQVLLEHYLKQLKLPTMLREYPKLAGECAQQGVGFQRAVGGSRDAGPGTPGRRQASGSRRAKFPVVKSLETFDYLAIPSLNKELVVELARCEWIGRRENVLALGNSGTGKTHIALALGPGGFAAGHAGALHPRPRRWCRRCWKPGTRQVVLPGYLLRQELLIVDELGYVPVVRAGPRCCSRCSASATNGARRW